MLDVSLRFRRNGEENRTPDRDALHLSWTPKGAPAQREVCLCEFWSTCRLALSVTLSSHSRVGKRDSAGFCPPPLWEPGSWPAPAACQGLRLHQAQVDRNKLPGWLLPWKQDRAGNNKHSFKRATCLQEARMLPLPSDFSNLQYKNETYLLLTTGGRSRPFPQVLALLMNCCDSRQVTVPLLKMGQGGLPIAKTSMTAVPLWGIFGLGRGLA